jgi:alkanesulfonate monooxygenase SsuD/methylene tetrahydromethanopterin reductase-like flavin-dependent oxidoreductase (luciferase family)
MGHALWMSMTGGQSAVFAAGSVSLRCYAPDGDDAVGVVDELCGQAQLAVEHGFDGVTTAEHHGGFPGYLPNPIQLAGFLLAVMPCGWAAPCPVVLPLRPAALVAEEIAWLAARYPGRVGVGVAAGGLERDFEVMDVALDDLARRFGTAVNALARFLRGDAGVLAGDQAIERCATHPVALVSAAASATAARRAAVAGAGLLFDSLVTPTRVRALVDCYHEAGGNGPRILVRRAWVGAPPGAPAQRQVDVYRNYAPAGSVDHWGTDEFISGSASAVVEQLVTATRAAGASSLDLRVHVPGVPAESVREQITRLGNDVVPHVHAALAPA